MILDFEKLIEEYHPMIYKICWVYSHTHDFDDLYQEVLINIWKGHKKFRGESKVSTWMYRVVLNTGLTFSRNNKEHQNKVSVDSVLEVPVSTYQAYEKEERISQLNEAIKRLSKTDRAIILLFLEEKSYKEIAEITGMTISNVGVTINRIKKRLYKLLEQNG